MCSLRDPSDVSRTIQTFPVPVAANAPVSNILIYPIDFRNRALCFRPTILTIFTIFIPLHSPHTKRLLPRLKIREVPNSLHEYESHSERVNLLVVSSLRIGRILLSHSGFALSRSAYDQLSNHRRSTGKKSFYD